MEMKSGLRGHRFPLVPWQGMGLSKLTALVMGFSSRPKNRGAGRNHRLAKGTPPAAQVPCLTLFCMAHCVCVHMCAGMRVHARSQTCAHTGVYLCVRVSMCAHTSVHICVCLAQVCTHVSVLAHVSTCVGVCICTCLCVCMRVMCACKCAAFGDLVSRNLTRVCLFFPIFLCGYVHFNFLTRTFCSYLGHSFQGGFNCFTSGISQVRPSWIQCREGSSPGSVQVSGASMMLSSHVVSGEFRLSELKLLCFRLFLLPLFARRSPYCLPTTSVSRCPEIPFGSFLLGDGNQGHGVGQPELWCRLH